MSASILNDSNRARAFGGADSVSLPSLATLAQRPGVLRTLLALGCITSILAAAAYGQPELLKQADPEWSWLMRGMAIIKASLVTAIAAVLAWRFGKPLTPRIAVGYLVGVWLMAGATMLIWQLTFIGSAAVVFHIGEALLLLTLWMDHRSPVST